MKRGVIAVVFVSVMILSLSFASASLFGDFWGKITGGAITGSTITGNLIYGDSNQDSVFNANDVAVVRAYLSGTINITKGSDKFIASDVNGDGFIGWNDLKLMNNVLANRNITAYPIQTNGPFTNASCTDSDGGEDYSTKGKVNGLDVNGNPSPEQTDYCVVSAYIASGTLREFYCNPLSGVTGVNMLLCPNGCLDGACKIVGAPAEPTEPTCIDSDGENYYNYSYIKEQATGWARTTDTCVNSTTVEERVCSNGVGANKYFACSAGCVNGACIKSAVVNCKDSDGGKDYFNRGNCTDNKGVMDDGCIIGGVNDGWLREITCDDFGSGLACQMNDYNCPNGCLNGLCIQKNVSTSYCKDSDGMDYFVNGNLGGFVPIKEVFKERSLNYSEGLEVYSSTTATLKVEGTAIKVDALKTYRFPVGNIYIDRIDFFGIGDSRNFLTFHLLEVFDFCRDNNRVVEWVCESNFSEGFDDETYECPYGCVNGACLKESVTKCGDGKISSGEECDDGNNINGDSCSRLCKKEICYDTDEGIYPNIKGNVTFTPSCPACPTGAFCKPCFQTPRIYVDFCDAGTGLLNEFYCENENFMQAAMECSVGTMCSNGACVSTLQINFKTNKNNYNLSEMVKLIGGKE